MSSSARGNIGLYLIIAIVVILGVLLAGGSPVSKYEPRGGRLGVAPEATSSGQCCDNGDGDSCTPVTSKEFKWKTDTYQLIKSDVTFTEGTAHFQPATPPNDTIKPADTTVSDLVGKRIYLNTTESSADYPDCGSGDLVFGDKGCVSIPNDIVIYVCKPFNPGDCTNSIGKGGFDAYIRVNRSEIIPDVIKKCTIAPQPLVVDPAAGSVRDQLVCPSTSSADLSLQLKNCKVVRKPPGTIPWLSPYCKPAIYLYPEETAQIHVNVSPVGKMNYTDPQYPNGGWQVQASPNGNITYQDKSYPYLYYEAEIPNQNIQKPSDGFVVDYNNISSTLDKILPELGLNSKEASAFKEYWIKVLPKVSFYFIGIMPESNLDSIAPLDISPKPDKIIRVTLYFQALDQKITVSEPRITTPIRTGFTVVEWGGIFQKDLNHPFSCFM